MTGTFRKKYIERYCKESFQREPKIFEAKLHDVLIDEQTRLRKVEIGQNTYRAEEKIILAIGAAGSGKSTLINALYNYIMGIEYTDDFRIRLIDEGQTRWITAYTIHHQTWFRIPYTLTIIDTSGFGDTKGFERDKEIMSQIHKFFSSANIHKIDHIDVIGFVATSSAPRLTITQHYIIKTVLSSFGKDIKENISMLFTFTDTNRPQILTTLEKADVPYKQYFKFNNAVIFSSTENCDDDDELFCRVIWKQAFKNFDMLMKEVSTAESKTLYLSAEVLRNRQELEMVVERIQRNLQMYTIEVSQLKKEEQILKKHQADIEQNECFTYTQTVRRDKKIPSETGATNCNICIKPDTPINVYTRFCLNTAKSKFSLVSPVADW